MFQILGKLNNNKYYVAFSGGKDSVVFTHYLLNKGYDITLLHFNHNLSIEDQNAFEFTTEFAKKYSLELIVDFLNKEKQQQESPEEYQRKHRYLFLNKFTDAPIILNHNLDDNVETWLFSSIHGQSKLIPYQRNNCIRPFMLNSVENILLYIKENNLTYYEDKTNLDINIPRNFIRHEMIKQVLKINPGFFNMIKKRILKKFKNEY